MKIGTAALYLLSSTSFAGLAVGDALLEKESRVLRMMMKKKTSSSKGKSKSSVEVVIPATAINDNFTLQASPASACSSSYDILGNDLNIPMGATIQITVPPKGGTVTVMADGTIMYARPSPCFTPGNVVIDQFQYAICDQDGMNCSNSATAIIAVYDTYAGINVGFNRRHLFALLDGEEHHRHLSKYEANKNEGVHYCMVETSQHYGMAVSHGDCEHPDNQVKDASEITDYEMEPWAFPTMEGATLLANDPGLWLIDDFISEEEVDKLLDLMKKNGEDRGLYGPCKQESQKTNAHPSERKLCFKISAVNACDGPYSASKCDAAVDPEDGAFVATLIKRFESMWSVNVEAHPYIKLHHIQGDTPPMDLHLDARTSISLVLYLNDGGAATLFPFASDGLSNVPKKGSALTWLNVHSNGSINPKAYHAVQAHPLELGERNTALFQIDLKDDTIKLAAY